MIVEESVREIKQSTLNGAWQKFQNEVILKVSFQCQKKLKML